MMSSSSSSFHRNSDSEFPIFPTNNNIENIEKKNKKKKQQRSCFASASLLGLGCRSPASSEAYAPSSSAVSAAAAADTVRSPPAEWQGKRPSFSSSSRSRRNSKKKNDIIKNNHQTSSSSSSSFSAADVSFVPPLPPRFPVDDDDDTVDYVVRRHHSMMLARAGRYDADRVHRDIMKFQARMSGGLNICDRYRDLRLDVDRMSYEELLELGDRIGYVSTGLREDEISESLRKMKHSVFDSSQLRFSTEMERKCSICQEEYEVNEDIGKLECGHSYHMYCIKQWLLQKNACPVCKTAVTKT